MATHEGSDTDFLSPLDKQRGPCLHPSETKVSMFPITGTKQMVSEIACIYLEDNGILLLMTSLSTILADRSIVSTGLLLLFFLFFFCFFCFGYSCFEGNISVWIF